MKFNVKNCPSYNRGVDECRSEHTAHICCWMNETCLIKKIAELCKANPIIWERLDIEVIDDQ